MTERIYLDHAATTPMRPEAVAAVAEGMARWANPSSPHAEGRAARAALEDARGRIAAALGWTGEVILTSGASEALAIALGRAKGGRRFVSAVEHDAVFRAAPDAEVIGVSSDGFPVPFVSSEVETRFSTSLEANGEGDCSVIAVQHVNSETGVVQPIDDIARQVREAGGILICDCAQSAGKLPVPDADMIVVSAHKLGGPPGVGALLVRDLGQLAATGGQERGYRGGTENLPGALGFAAALEANRGWAVGMAAHRRMLDGVVLSAGGEIVGRDSPRSPLIASYRLPAMSAAAQLVRLDLAGFAVSAGSACASGSLKPSRVLAALGIPEAAASETIRVSFGWTTTRAEISAFADAWSALAREARTRAA